MELDRSRISDFYCRLLHDDFMPFWKKACDTEFGGIFTCYSNDGSKLLSTDKYVWSQGRAIWMLARYVALIDRGLIQDENRDFFLEHAKKTAAFVLENAVLPPSQGVTAYLLERDGTKKENRPGAGFYTSYFVDTFVIMGLAELARVTQDKAMLQQAIDLYDRTRSYLARGEIVSDPYPQAEGYLIQANGMIMTNMTAVLFDAAQSLGHPRYQSFVEDAVCAVKEVLDECYSPELGLLREQIPHDPSNADTLLAKYIAPGHAVESMWFCRYVIRKVGLGDDYLKRVYEIIKNSIRTGWDDEYGGLLRMVGYDGKQPQGRHIGHPEEKLIEDTWDSKLWWTHSECLYATLLCYLDTGDREFWELYEMFHEYVFRVFPNPNRAIGEWLQILDRDGKPMEKIVALPVKDPYHIVRNFILIVELMNQGEG